MKRLKPIPLIWSKLPGNEPSKAQKQDSEGDSALTKHHWVILKPVITSVIYK